MRHVKLLRMILILAIAFLIQRMPANAIQDPNDFGVADTVGIALASYPDATTGQHQFRLDVYGRFDVDTISAIGSGFVWSNPNVRLDSARASSDASAAFDYVMFFYYRNSRDSSNAHRWITCSGARISSAGLMPSVTRRLLAKYYFTAMSWSSSDSVVFDSARFSTGSKLKVSKTNRIPFVPMFSRRIVLYDVPPPTLVSPANGDSSSFGTPTLNWNDVTGADKYRVQVDNDSTFGSPDRDVSNLTSSQWTVSPGLGFGTWYWRVNATDDGTGKTSGWSTKWKYKRALFIEKPLVTTDGENLPTEYRLYENYPNPFNAGTVIRFDLVNPGHVTLKVFNALGQVVTTLVNEEKPVGRYSVDWQGTDDHGKSVASGMYFYRLETTDRTETKKMVLLK